MSNGALRVHRRSEWDGQTGTHLDGWLLDDRLRYWLNHEARGHMESDLRRYVYAAEYAELYEDSPKGHHDFNLPGLEPDHKNWKTGKFSDRFRVQRRGFRPRRSPATLQRTVTISFTTTQGSAAA